MKIDDIEKAIADNLKAYSEDITKEINTQSHLAAKEAVKKLKRSSPKRLGKYKRGWRLKKHRSFAKSDSYTIHNKQYRLTHLLEFGHAKVNGGRVEAQPHIEKVEKEMIDEFLKKVKGVIKHG